MNLDKALGPVGVAALTWMYCFLVFRKWFRPGALIVGREGWPVLLYLLPVGGIVLLSVIGSLFNLNEDLLMPYYWAILIGWAPMGVKQILFGKLPVRSKSKES